MTTRLSMPILSQDLELCLDRGPDRDTFPFQGRVFYIHAARVTRWPEVSVGSVTALPLIDTTNGDMSYCIPANLRVIAESRQGEDDGVLRG